MSVQSQEPPRVTGQGSSEGGQLGGEEEGGQMSQKPRGPLAPSVQAAVEQKVRDCLSISSSPRN